MTLSRLEHGGGGDRGPRTATVARLEMQHINYHRMTRGVAMNGQISASTN